MPYSPGREDGWRINPLLFFISITLQNRVYNKFLGY